MSTKQQRIYDYVVIGAGLGGLCVATGLHDQGFNVALVDAADVLGGHNRAAQTPVGPMDRGIKFFPDSELAQKALRFLFDRANLPFEVASRDNSPVTFSSGEFCEFLGFGDQAPKFYSEINYYLSRERLCPQPAVHQLVQALVDRFRGEVIARSIVTKIEVQEGRVVSICLNGSKLIQAKKYVYCGPIKDLSHILSSEAMPAKARQRLAKGDSWTALCLDVCHEKVVTENQQMHLLNGTTADEIGPCVGFFHSPHQESGATKQFSQWVTFLSHNDAEDAELLAAALKKIKRQIKRAYPEALEQLSFERIFVAPAISGDYDLKLRADQRLLGIDNLWLGSGGLNSQQNLLGTLLQAELVLASLNSESTPQRSVQLEADELLDPQHHSL